MIVSETPFVCTLMDREKRFEMKDPSEILLTAGLLRRFFPDAPASFPLVYSSPPVISTLGRYGTTNSSSLKDDL